MAIPLDAIPAFESSHPGEASLLSTRRGFDPGGSPEEEGRGPRGVALGLELAVVGGDDQPS